MKMISECQNSEGFQDLRMVFRAGFEYRGELRFILFLPLKNRPNKSLPIAIPWADYQERFKLTFKSYIKIKLFDFQTKVKLIFQPSFCVLFSRISQACLNP